jgi:predicted esterase
MIMLRALTFALLLLPGILHATDETIVLEDGSTVKVFLFYPKTNGEGPWPLSVLMSGGVANEYIVRAQFWLGHELASRGWVIAVPVAPDASAFFGENGEKIPKVIAQLQEYPAIEKGKTLLVGVSNGGSSALEIAGRNPENYFGVVAVPGIIRPGVDVGDFANLPVVIRIGENDYLRWNRELPRITAALSEAGARVDAKLQPGASHVFTIDWDELQPWLDSLR